MKLNQIENDKYYPIRYFLKVLEDLGLPHSVIWFEIKLKAGVIPREFIIQEKKNTNRFIQGKNIKQLLRILFNLNVL